MNVGKVYTMACAMLWNITAVNEETNEVVILTSGGEKKHLRYFETDDCVGLKNACGDVVIERWK